MGRVDAFLGAVTCLSFKTTRDLKVVIRASVFEGQILTVRENETVGLFKVAHRLPLCGSDHISTGQGPLLLNSVAATHGRVRGFREGRGYYSPKFSLRSLENELSCTECVG